MSMPQGENRPPHLMLAAAELARATAEMSLLPLAACILRRAERGDGHPVMVLPGFTASDGATLVLRRYLAGLGYEVHPWDLGANLDHHSTGRDGERLQARLDAIRGFTGQKVSLIGWSLGGMLAREAARRDPEAVRQVISLGSPFAGSPRATNVWRAFEWMTGQDIRSDSFQERCRAAARPLPVPASAIFSKTDGIVAWRNCLEPEGPLSDNIEVCGSHCGLVVNPTVLYAIADRLAQPEDGWAPFDRGGWRAAFYPSSGHLH